MGLEIWRSTCQIRPVPVKRRNPDLLIVRQQTGVGTTRYAPLMCAATSLEQIASAHCFELWMGRGQLYSAIVAEKRIRAATAVKTKISLDMAPSFSVCTVPTQGKNL